MKKKKKGNGFGNLVTQVFVEVLDENDHVPLTLAPIYWVDVAENSPPATAVARIGAADADRNPRQRLTYRLKAGNPQSLFEIDAKTGRRRPSSSFSFPTPLFFWFPVFPFLLLLLFLLLRPSLRLRS